MLILHPSLGSLVSSGLCDADATTTAIVPTTTEPVETTKAVWTTRLPPGTLPDMFPLRGIAYGALPCTQPGCASTGWVNEDMLQEAYSKQWGEQGRDDLNTMVTLASWEQPSFSSRQLIGKAAAS